MDLRLLVQKNKQGIWKVTYNRARITRGHQFNYQQYFGHLYRRLYIASQSPSTVSYETST